MIAFAAPWSIDESRFAIESIPPREYLGVPYYARWLRSFERLLVKYQFVTEQELKNPDGRLGESTKDQPPDAATILRALENGISPRRDHGKPARFRVGDRVIVKNEHPAWHTPRHVMSVAGKARYTETTVCSSSRTAVPRSAVMNNRNTATTWCSPLPSCGAVWPIQETACTSTCLTTTWNPCRRDHCHDRCEYVGGAAAVAA